MVLSDLVDDTDYDWIEDQSEPEVKVEPEMEQMLEQELTNLQVLEWLHDLPADPKKTILPTQDVDHTSIKYISHDNTESNWVAPNGPLRVPESDRYFCLGNGDRTHPHQKSYDQKIEIGEGNRRAGNGGRKR